MQSSEQSGRLFPYHRPSWRHEAQGRAAIEVVGAVPTGRTPSKILVFVQGARKARGRRRVEPKGSPVGARQSGRRLPYHVVSDHQGA